jgi:hypothetical protein
MCALPEELLLGQGPAVRCQGSLVFFTLLAFWGFCSHRRSEVVLEVRC